MAKGKFSGPRPYREEERQIEQAFRQVTEPGKSSEYTPTFPASSMPQLERKPLSPVAQEQGDPAWEETPVTAPPEDPDFPQDLEETLSESGLYEQTEQAEQDTPDFLDKLMAFVESNRKMVLVGACGLVLVLILTFLAIFFLGSGGDPYNSKILSNVMIGGVNVGGLTKSQATQVVKNNVAPLYTGQDMTVRVGTTTLTLASGDTKAELDVKDAVNAAYSYGRTGTKAEKQAAYTASFSESHTIALLPYLQLDTNYIQSVLDAYADTVGSTLTQTSYALEGIVPELGTDVFDPETAPQLTLVVTMGTPGVDFQEEGLYNAILDAYSLATFQVTWEATQADALPQVPDMAQVLTEVGKEAVDDSVDLQTFAVVPGSYGYTFDVAAAQAQVEGAQFGQILRIPMTYVAPERMGEDAFYQQILGRGRTAFSSNENRVNNLRLACQALDGVVLNPGQTLSFNETVGQRTTERGYKSAMSDTAGSNAVGGGVSQVATTLYYAALTADLEVTERHAHTTAVSYVDMGLDAAVSNSWDLQLKNNANFPVKLSAKAEDGYVTVEILGTDEKDYTISLTYAIANTYEPETEYVDYPADNARGYQDGDVLQNGSEGCSVRSYKNKYDKLTGASISRDFITTTVYQPVTKIVVRIVPEETIPPATETEPPATTLPTQPVEPTLPTQPETPDTGTGTPDGGTGTPPSAAPEGSTETPGTPSGSEGSGDPPAGDTPTPGSAAGTPAGDVPPEA